MNTQRIHDPAPQAQPTAGLNRSEILRAAQRCFNQHGYDGTTIRRIAGEMDCAVGSIYRYFRDKRELLLALAQLDLRPVVLCLESRGSWRESVQLYHQLATKAKDRYLMMFWLARVESSSTPAASPTLTLPPVVQDILAWWERIFDSSDIAQRLFIVLHGCVMAGVDGDTTLTLVQKQLPTMAWLHPAAESSPSTDVSLPPKPQVLPVAALGQVMRQPVLVTLDALSLTQSSPEETIPVSPRLPCAASPGGEETP